MTAKSENELRAHILSLQDENRKLRWELEGYKQFKRHLREFVGGC